MVRQIREWAVTLVLMLWATSMVAQAFVVPTGSMESTVMTGDHIVVDKVAYGSGSSLLPHQEVRRGDVVTFRYPLGIDKMFVKRVIGVPGDRVRLEENRLYLNGRLTAEPYVQLAGPNLDPYAANFPSVPPVAGIYPRGAAMLRDHVREGELIVPEGYYLCLGDNRQNSDDSRYWGLVPRENIVGKPLLVWWSFDAPTEYLDEYSPRQVWNLVTTFVTKTRWDRTLQFIRAYPLG
jgi:signal peptidase I